MNKPELPVLTSDTYQGYSCVYADAGMTARTGVCFGLRSQWFNLRLMSMISRIHSAGCSRAT